MGHLTIPQRRSATRPGLFGPDFRGWATASVGLASGTAYISKVAPERNMAITLAWFNTSVASGTDDPVEIALFDDALTERIATSGSVTGKLNVLGPQTVPLVATLVGGVRYSVVFKAASTTSVRFATISTASISEVFGTTAELLLLATKTGLSTPLPSSISSPAAASQVPLVALREV